MLQRERARKLESICSLQKACCEKADFVFGRVNNNNIKVIVSS